jgi:hypothetical protein
MHPSFKQLDKNREQIVSKIKHALNEHDPNLQSLIDSLYQELETANQELANVCNCFYPKTINPFI